jgi:hypothetical protein
MGQEFGNLTKEIIILGNGQMEKWKDMESILQRMGKNMKAILKTF